MKLSLIIAICVLSIVVQVSARRKKHKYEEHTTTRTAVTAGKQEKTFCQFLEKDCRNIQCEASKVSKCVFNPAEDKNAFCACVPKECLTDDAVDVKDDDGCDRHCKTQDNIKTGKCTTEPESYARVPQKCTCSTECEQFVKNSICDKMQCEPDWEGSCIFLSTVAREPHCACEPKGCYLNWGKPNQVDMKDTDGCRRHCEKLNKRWGGSCVSEQKQMYESGTPHICRCFGEDYPDYN